MGTTTYTKEVGDKICERLAEGDSLRKICAESGMPSRWSVFRWLDDEANEAFRNQYARAREWQAESLMDEILEISDDASRDVVTKGEGEEAYDRERFTASARDKIKIDARFKLMGQLNPKKYGAKMSLAVTETNPVNKLTDEELLDEIRKLAPNQ